MAFEYREDDDDDAPAGQTAPEGADVQEIELPPIEQVDPHLVLGTKDGTRVVYGPFKSLERATVFAATLDTAEVLPHAVTPEPHRDGWLFDEHGIAIFSGWLTLTLLSLATTLQEKKFFTEEMPQEVRAWAEQEGLDALARKSAEVVKGRIISMVLGGIEAINAGILKMLETYRSTGKTPTVPPSETSH
jgi:hypothetical protein